jgi:hypothetical protein
MFLDRFNYSKAVHLPTELGIMPENLFTDKSIACTDTRFPIVAGISPSRLLFERLRESPKVAKTPISGGRGPCKLLKDKSSCIMREHWLSLMGIFPDKLLFLLGP